MFQIFNALMVVNDVFGCWVVIQCINREITTRSILRMGTKFVVTQDTTVFVCRLRFRSRSAKGRGLNDLLTKYDVHQLEASSDDTRAPEQRTHLLGCRVGGNVKVFGL